VAKNDVLKTLKKLDYAAELKRRLDKIQKLIDDAAICSSGSVDILLRTGDPCADKHPIDISDQVRDKVFTALVTALKTELASIIKEVNDL